MMTTRTKGRSLLQQGALSAVVPSSSSTDAIVPSPSEGENVLPTVRKEQEENELQQQESVDELSSTSVSKRIPRKKPPTKAVIEERKSSPQPLLIDLNKVSSEPPYWRKPLPGLLIAIVKDKPLLYSSNMSQDKGKIIELFDVVSKTLAHEDIRMNAWSVLEKWCWLMEMFHYSSLPQTGWNWSYQNSLAFLKDSSSSGYQQYLNCLPRERIDYLSTIYSKLDIECMVPTSDWPEPCHVDKFFSLSSELEFYRNHVTANLSKPEESSSASPPTLSSVLFDVPALDISNCKTIDTVTPIITRNINARRGRPRKKPLPDVPPLAPNSSIGDPPCLNANSISSDIEKKKIQDTPTTESLKRPVSTSPNNATNHSNNEGEEMNIKWTSIMITTMIEEVKKRPSIWHSSHPDYKNQIRRKENFTEIATIISALNGVAPVNDDSVSGKWSIVEECFKKNLNKVKNGSTANSDPYSRLEFLTREGMAAHRFDDIPKVHHSCGNISPSPSIMKEDNSDVTNQLSRIFGFVPPPAADYSPLEKKKRTSLTPPEVANNQKDKIPITTWVPPKEDSIAAAMQMQHSPHQPTATAQIMTTHSPLAALLKVQSQQQQQQQQHRMISSPRPFIQNGSAISYTGELNEQGDQDKWALFSRYMVQACREVEARSFELGIHLQKEITDTLFNFQLRSLKKSNGQSR